MAKYIVEYNIALMFGFCMVQNYPSYLTVWKDLNEAEFEEAFLSVPTSITFNHKGNFL